MTVLSGYDAAERSIRVIGKGNKQRLLYVTPDAVARPPDGLEKSAVAYRTELLAGPEKIADPGPPRSLSLRRNRRAARGVPDDGCGGAPRGGSSSTPGSRHCRRNSTRSRYWRASDSRPYGDPNPRCRR
jgi:hypothetical protein